MRRGSALALLLLLAGRAAAQAGSEAPGREDASADAASEAEGRREGREARRAASVDLLLPPGEDRAAALPLLAVTPGSPVTARALRRSALRLFQAGRCRDVVIREAEAPAPAGQPGRWVALTVTCVARRLLAGLEITLDGPSPLSEGSLHVTAALEAGAPVDEVDLEAAAARVRAALRRRGHREAVVQATLAGDRAVTARLRVRAGGATSITALRLPGSGGAEGGLLAALALKPGAVLDEDRLDEDVKVLRGVLQKEGHWRARVGAPQIVGVPGGASVEIPVEPGPHVTVAIRGAAAFTEAELRPQLQVDAGQPFTAPAIEAAADRLRGFYRVRGFAAARVEAEERAHAGELAVIFHVDEGRSYRLARIGIEGSGAWRSEEALRERLVTLLEEEAPAVPPLAGTERARAVEASVPGVRPLHEPPAALPPGSYLDEALLERAAEALIDEYKADGFLEAVLFGWTAELDAVRGEAAVTIRLREGERTKVDSIGFEGYKAIPLAQLVKEARQEGRLAPGDPLVWERVEATRLAILKLYHARSYVYARVEVREQVDRERHQAELRYVVEEGPQVRIGRILVSGNTRTRHDVVRGALQVKEGALHDPEAMARSQAALLRLGVFRSVSLRLQDPEVPEPTKDLAVELSERPWQYLAPGGGFSIANGPRLFLEYGRPNLLGRALDLTGRAKVNYPLSEFRDDLRNVSPKNTIEYRANVGLRAPDLALLPWPVTSHTDLVGERLRRRAYDLARGSWILGGDLAATSHVTLSLQYEIEIDRIDKSSATGVLLTQADQHNLLFPAGTTTLHSVRQSATVDYRDNAAHPHRGWFASGSAEYERSLGGPQGKFLFLPGSSNFTSLWKLQATGSVYLPVGSGTVLALSARGGLIIPQVFWSQTIGPKRFFLGGADTIRGFAEEEMVPEDRRARLAQEGQYCASSISGAGCTASGAALAAGKTVASEGGQASLLFKGELRQSLGGSLELGLFVDLGNLWLDQSKFRLLDLRPSAGFGLRFVTPVGPAALDLGFNLAPDHRINEASFAPHFTIGLF